MADYQTYPKIWTFFELRFGEEGSSCCDFNYKFSSLTNQFQPLVPILIAAVVFIFVQRPVAKNDVSEVLPQLRFRCGIGEHELIVPGAERFFLVVVEKHTHHFGIFFLYLDLGGICSRKSSVTDGIEILRFKAK
jgi:hypothetical protein